MFIIQNEWKGIAVDTDSIPEEFDARLKSLSENAGKKILFCGNNKERLKKIEAMDGPQLTCDQSPFGKAIFYPKVYARLLSMLQTRSCETAVITGSRQALKQAQNHNISNLFFCGGEELPGDLIVDLPDHIAQSWEDIEKAVRGESAGYLAEYCAERYADKKDDWQALRTIRTELKTFGGNTCPLIAAGRYFSQSDPRAYGHQLSKRILLHKWEDTAQTEIFTETYRQIIGSAICEKIDAVTRIPPKDSRQFDRFAAITRAAADDTGAEDLSEQLVCVKKYGSQRTLNRAEREANVKGAFEMKKEVKGKHIVLLDDILTSGATAAEAADELYLRGAEKVTVVVLAIKQNKNNFLDEKLVPIRCRKCGGEMQLRINRTTQEAFFGCRELYNKEAPCTYIEGYKKAMERRNSDAGFANESESKFLF
ncbi:hypothetical protein NE619_11430 [Anaerovorax odorimutans]|uniref:Phosphoribosyltransferase domain-containing protein n=1 Tax=Anaerovorax odorimutans TaxID=109327 RepID=A0ABT1RQ72_9FIRM|nr:phosphoribosyltransferase family protein [Anaerovorax odorimutans]MCQ4637335.1 hypothetical protein [Anaerovorax odorimutans]